jgi:hypothetical protein
MHFRHMQWVGIFYVISTGLTDFCSQIADAGRGAWLAVSAIISTSRRQDNTMSIRDMSRLIVRPYQVCRRHIDEWLKCITLVSAIYFINVFLFALSPAQHQSLNLEQTAEQTKETGKLYSPTHVSVSITFYRNITVTKCAYFPKMFSRMGVRVTKITGSRFDDWVIEHFFIITINWLSLIFTIQ